VIGDVFDGAALRRCFAGVEVVYHIAGVNRLCASNPAEMYRVNVEGTESVARAAVDTRLVYTSSAATLGEAEGEIGSETTAPVGEWMSHYARSKANAEGMVRLRAQRQDVVIVNPSSVQGPGRASGTGRLLLGVMSGRLRTLVETRISIVDIDDCARGHLLAAARGQSGERYVLNSFSMALSEAVGVVENIVGRPLPVRYLPPAIARIAGSVAGTLFRVVGRDAPVCAESIRTILHGHVYDGSRAARELGLEYTPADVTMRRLYEWAQREGKL
jgi:dihydroflavonol-4-reductase